MYGDILVSTDGSEHTRAAARRALDLAERYDATVNTLYVIDTDTILLTNLKSEVRDSLCEVGGDVGGQALAATEELASEFTVDLVTGLREGTPDEVILDYVDDENVDLVVMGTHGWEDVRRRLVGSVAERVVREAAVPVMTITEPAKLLRNSGKSRQNPHQNEITR